MSTRRRWWRRKRRPEEFAEEIQAHLAMEQDEMEARGFGPEAARAAARRTFGNLTAAQERHHESGRLLWADSLWKDVAFAFRMLRKARWFTAAAIVILGLAIGANLAVFTLVDALLWRGIPVTRPEELVRIDLVGPQGSLNGMPSTVLESLRREAVFAGVCGFSTPGISASLNGAISNARVLAMSGDCWKTLGVETQIGRPFAMEDDRPEAPNVAVLSASVWRSAYGGAADVIGKQIQAGAESYTVIGVASDRFTGMRLGFDPALIIPLHHTPTDDPGRRYVYWWVSVFARRASGVTENGAAARVAAIAPALLEQSAPRRYDAEQRRNYLANRMVVESARTGVASVLRRRFGGPLLALWGICGAILLIACLNLASLLVARTLARQKELAIRLAIGATRWRVLRPLALESLLLAAGGGAVGVVFARWAADLMAAQAAAIISTAALDTSMGARGIGLLVAVVGLVGLVLTAVPVWQAGRAAESGAFREAGRGIVGSNARAQKVLIGAQVAFTLALVTAGGVFASSFRNLANVPLGLRMDSTAEALLLPLPGGYHVTDPSAYYTNLLSAVSGLPGVRSASLTSFPLFWYRVQPETVRAGDTAVETRAQIIRVSHGYFGSIGTRLVAGEDFRRDATEPQAIVSEAVAAALGGGVVGRYVVTGEGASAKRRRVIGVAPTMTLSMADVRDAWSPVVYLNFWQERAQQRYPTLLVQGSGGRAPDARAIGQAVASLGVEYAQEYLPLESAHGLSIVEDRLLAYLAGAFAGLALALAAVGLFAILSCYVARRTGEFGVRIALGAGAGDLRRLVLRQIGVVMGAGIAAGLGLALATGRALASLAYGVTPASPTLLGPAVLLVVAAALAAAWLPARRAAGVEVVEALRRE